MKQACFVVIALLVIAQATATTEEEQVSTSYFDQLKNMGQDMIMSQIQKHMMTNELQNSVCPLSTATQCFSNLKGVFAGCTAAIAASGSSILSDFACVKSLWELRNTEFKLCFSCVCEFTQFIHFKLPLCPANQVLLQSGVNVFEQLAAFENQV